MTKIEWCDETINPLGWGCYGPGGTPENPKRCWYCYAYRIAKRGLRDCPKCKIFIPHWHQEAFYPLFHWRKPRRIFVQSMGDMFGSFVPNSSQIAILSIAQHFPRHTFIFLTKEPWNLSRWNPFPYNTWVGISATNIIQIGAIPILANVVAPVKFVSFEPLLEYATPDLRKEWVQWVIIGAMTGPGAKSPQLWWVEDIISRADILGIPVFLKNNLLKLFPNLPRRQEFPKS